MNFRSISSTAVIATAAVLLSVGVQTLAYSAATASPPGGDAAAPLNTSSASQTKSGDLTATNLKANGGITAYGSAGVTSPRYCIGTDCILAWPTGGAGGIASLAAGSGITFTPASPITAASVNPTIAADLSVVQKRLSGTCVVGASITAIDPATGVITCGKVIRAGSYVADAAGNVETVTISPAMPDSTYSLQVSDNGTSNTDCKIQAVTKTAASFSFSKGDICSGVPYNWVAIDY